MPNMSVYLLASILPPTRREYEGAQGAPHRVIAQLCLDILGYRPLDFAQRFRAALHDRTQDGIALDQPRRGVGSRRARPGHFKVCPADLTEAGLLQESPDRLGFVEAERHRVERRRIGRGGRWGPRVGKS